MDKKICTKCKKEKNLTEFHKNKRMKDGYFYYCKECKSIEAKKEYNYKEIINNAR